jgi:hypothetical protein
MGVTNGLRRPEAKIEPHAAGDAVGHRNAGPMRSDDLHNDRQAQTGTIGANFLAAPKAFEDALTILGWDTRTAVLHTDRPLGADFDNDFALGRRMRKRILNEIAQCIGYCGSVASDQNRMIGAGERDRPAGRQRQMRKTTLATKASHCSRTLPLMPQLVQTLKSLSSLTLLAASRLCTMRSNFSGRSLSGYRLDQPTARDRRRHGGA